MYAYDSELMHYGILGMHWGIRRYQPYETTGPRKHGKKGAEIGEAAKVKQKRKRRKWNELSDEEKASIVRRIVLVGAGVAVATIGGTVAYRIGKEQLGYTIKGTAERVTVTEDPGIGHGKIYAAVNKADRKAYRGKMAGEHFRQYNKKYLHELNIDKVKVAGEIPARKTYENLLKNDPKFSEAAAQLFNKTPSYEIFNRKLSGLPYNEAHRYMRSAYFNALKAKGFGAINDWNDKNYFGKWHSNSHYDSKYPAIFFDTSKITLKSTKILSNDEIHYWQNKWYKSQKIKAITQELAPTYAPFVGIATTAAIAGTAGSEIKYQKGKKDNLKGGKRK